ncbi:NAD(P)/FAD-dependent oxidoreductase [Acidobacteria bacterium AH-259-D05]|nr:NAD(P)/FAD-dependent oxidoreductase [Acidobacteria bacterium AH-259-D05]
MSKLQPTSLQPGGGLHDVIVIGGGPAGLRLAYRLASDGCDTVLFDDRTEIGKHKICTGIVSTEAFDRFKLPRSSILNDIRKLKFFSPLGTELEYLHPSLLAHVVDRTAFDRGLAKVASQRGAKIRVGRRVDKVTVNADGVQVEAAAVGKPGERECFGAKIVVIATGVNFRLNKSLGLGLPRDFLSAAQAHIKVKNLDCTLCYVGPNIAPGAFAWVVPLGGEKARLGLMVQGKASHYFDNLLKRITHYRGTEPETIEVDFKPIAQGFVGKTCGNRVIAVGEAAGHVKTTTGGGIYYGLLSAELAAEVVIEALKRRRYDEEFLSQFEERWKEEIYQELNLGYSFRKAFARLSDRQIERLFTLASMNGILPLIRMKAEFDWHAEVLRAVMRYRVIQNALGLKLDNIPKP